jgi:hypothetical protein
MECHVAEYQSLVQSSAGLAGEELISFWADELPFFCRDAYLALTRRPTEILRLPYGAFDYIFDCYQGSEEEREILGSDWAEGRLVVACGRSKPEPRKRDDYRLAGWVGPTNKVFGAAWDKGHFIGHSLGGAVDRFEANVFIQRRDLNRGWSEEGKLFRKMEEYCVQNPNTFCFARPLYVDASYRPAFLDFGVLTKEGPLWVNRFDNRDAERA